MGITAVWLPRTSQPGFLRWRLSNACRSLCTAPCKASSQEGNGYDVYDIFDLGEFDVKGGKRTKWGTKEEYIECIKALKEAGVVSYIDAVLNHKAGADEKEPFHVKKVDPEDRTKEISDSYEIEGWTKFTFPGRGDKYSDFKWNWTHFTGTFS